MNWSLRKAVICSVLTVGLAAAAAAMGQGGGATPAPPPFPDGDGKKVVMDNCGGCHGLDQVQGAKHDLATWKETLSRMVTYGASITDAQMPTIAGYLAKSFPDPSKPDVKTDEKKEDQDAAGEKILNTACTTCHDLGPVTRRADDRAAWESTVYGMVGNGADVKDAEIPILVDYLVKFYGPKKEEPKTAAPATPATPAAPAGRGGRGGGRGQ